MKAFAPTQVPRFMVRQAHHEANDVNGGGFHYRHDPAQNMAGF
jgi:hypothetical protein